MLCKKIYSHIVVNILTEFQFKFLPRDSTTNKLTYHFCCEALDAGNEARVVFSVGFFQLKKDRLIVWVRPGGRPGGLLGGRADGVLNNFMLKFSMPPPRSI